MSVSETNVRPYKQERGLPPDAVLVIGKPFLFPGGAAMIAVGLGGTEYFRVTSPSEEGGGVQYLKYQELYKKGKVGRYVKREQVQGPDGNPFEGNVFVYTELPPLEDRVVVYYTTSPDNRAFYEVSTEAEIKELEAKAADGVMIHKVARKRREVVKVTPWADSPYQVFDQLRQVEEHYFAPAPPPGTKTNPISVESDSCLRCGKPGGV